MSKGYDKEEKGLGIHVRRTIAYIVLILVTIICLFWFYLLFVNATRSHSDILLNGFSFKPGNGIKMNYNKLLADGTIPIKKGLFNSLIIAVLTAVLTTYFSTMTAFALHAYDFRLKKFMFTFILMVMMIPTQVTALGFVKVMRDMKFTNQFWPLYLPSIAAPVTFFYIKQYMESCLPQSLIEAARIDGSGEIRTFNSIVIPLMKPAIAVQAIFAFVSSWNNYFTPALLLSKLEKKTLPILMYTLRSKDWAHLDYGEVYMMIAVSVLPVILVYVILSKNIVQGLTMGSVKE